MSFVLFKAGDVEIFDRKEFKNRKVYSLSVEIENGKITKVGALPMGVEPVASNSGSFANREFSDIDHPNIKGD